MIDNRFPFLLEVPAIWRSVADEVSRRCMVRTSFNKLRGELFFFRRDPNFGVHAEPCVRPDGSFVRFDSSATDRIVRAIQTSGGSMKDARRALDARQRSRGRYEADRIEDAAEQGTERGMKKIEHLRRRRTGAVVNGLKE